MLIHQNIPPPHAWLTLLLFVLTHFAPGEEKQTIKQRNTLKCKTNMEHKITSHVTFTSLSADSEILAAASSLTRAIVSAAPAAASAAARRACKKSK